MKTRSLAFRKFRARVVCALARYAPKLGDLEINSWLSVAEPCFKTVGDGWFDDWSAALVRFERTGIAFPVRGRYNVHYLPIWRRRFVLAS